MKEIEWHTSNPQKSGLYLTTRQMSNGKRYVMVNIWKGSDFPGNQIEHWEVKVADNSETIAWVSENEIKPYEL